MLVVAFGIVVATAAQHWTHRARAAAAEQAIVGVDRAGTVTVFNAGAERMPRRRRRGPRRPRAHPRTGAARAGSADRTHAVR